MNNNNKNLYNNKMIAKEISNLFVSEPVFKLNLVPINDSCTTFACVQDNKYMFVSVEKENIVDLYNIICRHREVQFNEYVNLDKPFLFHLDMDSDTVDLIENKEEIIKEIENLIRLENPEFNANYIITGSEDYSKKFHIIVPNLLCPNGDTYAEFVKKLDANLSDRLGFEVIEDKRYNSYRQTRENKLVSLRMIGSYKNGERRKMIQETTYNDININDCFLTRNFTSEEMKGVYTLNQQKSTIEHKKMSEYDKIINKEVNIEEVKTILDNLSQDKFEDYHSWLTLVWCMVKFGLEYDEIQTYCSSADNYDHDSVDRMIQNYDENRCSYRINTLYYYLKNSVSEEKYKEIVNMFKTNEVAKIDPLPLEDIEADEIIEVNNVGSYVPRLESAKGVFLRSNCMTFKTQNFKELFTSDKRIAIFTFRRSLGNSFLNEFKQYGFKLYSDLKTKTYTEDKIIIQFDSSHKLRGKYDLIIFDEFEYCKTHLISFAKEKKEIMNCLKQLVKACGNYIVSDALLNKKTIDFFKNTHEHEITIVDNKYKSFPNLETVLYEEGKNTSFVMTVFEKLQSGLKVACPSTSLKAANKLYSVLSSNPEYKVGLITSETEDIPVEKWVEYDCIIFTPTIVAGNSFNAHHFDEIVAYQTNMAANMEYFVQMLFRVRNLSQNTINIFCNNRRYYEPQTDLEIESDLARRDDLIQTETGLDLNIVLNKIIKNDYYYLYVDCKKKINLSRNQPLNVLTGLLEHHGISWRLEPYIEKSTKKIDADDALEQEFNFCFKKFKESEAQQVIDSPLITEEEYDSFKTKTKISKIEKCSMRKFIFYKAYNLEADVELTTDVLLKYYNYIPQFKNVKALNRRIDNEMNLKQLAYDYENSETEERLHIKFEPLKRVFCDKIVQALGFDNMLDTKQVNEINYSQIVDLIKEKENGFRVMFASKSLDKILVMDCDNLTKGNKQTIMPYVNQCLKGIFGDGATIERTSGKPKYLKYKIKGVNNFFESSNIIKVPTYEDIIQRRLEIMTDLDEFDFVNNEDSIILT